ncbi:hypothetical protein ES702_00602 [subsurface metagenome]
MLVYLSCVQWTGRNESMVWRDALSERVCMHFTRSYLIRDPPTRDGSDGILFTTGMIQDYYATVKHARRKDLENGVAFMVG